MGRVELGAFERTILMSAVAKLNEIIFHSRVSNLSAAGKGWNGLRSEGGNKDKWWEGREW